MVVEARVRALEVLVICSPGITMLSQGQCPRFSWFP